MLFQVSVTNFIPAFWQPVQCVVHACDLNTEDIAKARTCGALQPMDPPPQPNLVTLTREGHDDVELQLDQVTPAVVARPSLRLGDDNTINSASNQPLPPSNTPAPVIPGTQGKYEIT